MDPTPLARRSAGRALLVLTALALPLAAVTVSGPAADAATTLPTLPVGFVSTSTPSSGVFTVAGRAWGHRIGMSQVGAQYAGRAGFSAAAILAHYYPGTAITSVARSRWAVTWRGTPAGAARPQLRVKIDAITTPVLVVTATRSLSLWTAGKSTPLPAVARGSVPTRWRLVAVNASAPNSGVRLQYSTSATSNASTAWTAASGVLPLGTGFAASVAGAGVRVELPNGQARVEPTSVVLTTDHPGSIRWMGVTLLDLQTYVGVVASAEIGPSSAPATLGAQAIAARTYATRLATLYGATHRWDVCSDTCQYYPGVATGSVASGPTKDRARTSSTGSAAANATTDQVLTYRGAVILSMFAASNGGYSLSGGQPYLPAQPDAWDRASGSGSSAWSATLPASALAPLLPAGDRLTAIAVGGRDGRGDLGGTPSAVLLDSVSASGVPHRTSTTPSALRARWSWPSASTGLRSNWFSLSTTVTTPPASPATSPVTTSATAPAATVLLKYGSRGSTVVAVQRALHVSPTGFYGVRTRAAVTAFQRAHALSPTGTVDAATWRAIAAPTPTAAKTVARYGSRGSIVVAIQRVLHVRPTGYYGAQTRAGVTAFQRAHRIAASGVVDGVTWQALRRA